MAYLAGVAVEEHGDALPTTAARGARVAGETLEALAVARCRGGCVRAAVERAREELRAGGGLARRRERAQGRGVGVVLRQVARADAVAESARRQRGPRGHGAALAVGRALGSAHAVLAITKGDAVLAVVRVQELLVGQRLGLLDRRDVEHEDDADYLRHARDALHVVPRDDAQRLVVHGRAERQGAEARVLLVHARAVAELLA
jgi:hypothetical protein